MPTILARLRQLFLVPTTTLRNTSRARFARLGLEFLETRTVPAILVVTTLADNTLVDGLVTLREALLAAETDTTVDGVTGSGADVILFEPSLFTAGPATITFDGTLAPINNAASLGAAAFVITSDVTIVGPEETGAITDGSLTITRSGTTSFRFITVASTGHLTLMNLNISGFKAQGGDGGNIGNDAPGDSPGGGGGLGAGGAILNNLGSLTIDGVTFLNNAANGGRGGAAGSENASTADGSGGGGMGGSAAGSSGGLPNSGRPGGIGGGANGGQTSAIGGFGGGGSTGSGTDNHAGGAGGFGGGGGGGALSTGLGGAGGFGAGMGETSDGRQGGGGGGAGMGGAIFNLGGTVSILNSTFSANAAIGSASDETGTRDGAGLGGAIFTIGGSLTLTNATLSANTVAGNTITAAVGGGTATTGVNLYAYAGNVGVPGVATTTLVNIDSSILGQADATVADFASFSSEGTLAVTGNNNLIRNNPNVGGFTGGVVSGNDPRLGSLGWNGGPTQTMVPLDGSPALDRGAFTGNLHIDQRGAIRTISIDIGAVQVSEPRALIDDDFNGGGLGSDVDASPGIPGPGTGFLGFKNTGSSGNFYTESGSLAQTGSGGGGGSLSGIFSKDAINATIGVNRFIWNVAENRYPGFHSTADLERSFVGLRNLSNNANQYATGTGAVPLPGNINGSVTTSHGFYISMGDRSPIAGNSFNGYGGHGQPGNLIYVSPNNVITTLASWSWGIFNPSSSNISNRSLTITLDLTADHYWLSLSDPGITITYGSLTGSLTHGLNQAYVFTYQQIDRPGSGGSTGAVELDLDRIRVLTSDSTPIVPPPPPPPPATTFDYGDAPESYGTSTAYHGAMGPTLGSLRDTETSPNLPLDGTGDDNIGGVNDEDGVAFTVSANGTPLFVPGATQSVIVTTPLGGKLDAWIDFDGNGVFDIAEAIATNATMSTGTNVVTFTVPAGTYSGASFARFRISTAGNVGPTAAAFDGEVEDYAVRIGSIASQTGSITISFRDGVNGYASTQDTTLVQGTSGSYASTAGTAGTITVDIQGDTNPDGFAFAPIVQGLIRFDNLFGASGIRIPALSTITSAALSVNVTDTTTGTIRAHRMYADWSEATAVWTGFGPVDGVQWNREEAAEIPDASGISPSTFSGLASTVQSWANGGPANGWLLATDSLDSYSFRSSEAASILTRPLLSVTFTPPAQTMGFDFGDAPASYGTATANHAVSAAHPAPLLGNLRDLESAPPTLLDGTGDNTTGISDEDGVVFTGPTVAGIPYLVPGAAVSVVVTASGSGRLDAWIDFNGNGSFDAASETITSNLPVVNGENLVTFLVPADAVAGASYARFRISTVGGLSPVEPADDGEIEDYAIRIGQPNSGSVQVVFQNGLNGYGGAADTEIDRDYPTSNGNGKSAFGYSFADVTWDFGAFYLVRFEGLFGSGPGQIPVGSIVTSAALDLSTAVMTYDAYSTTPLTVTQLLVNVDPTTITWNGAAAVGNHTAGLQLDGVDARMTSDPSTRTFTPTQNRNSIDLTAIVQNWLSGAGNYGVLVTPTNPDLGGQTNSNTWKVIQSEDTATTTGRPRLRVTYTPPISTTAPFISGFTPTSGSTIGGTVVNILGANLESATSVWFGNTPASFTITSSSEITVTAPAHMPGPVTISIETPEGFATTTSNFTYIASAPTLADITPPIGTMAGGTTVVISGTDLAGATAVHFGSILAPFFSIDSQTQITASVPAAADMGIVLVTVTTPLGTSNSIQYEYAPPTPIITSQPVNQSVTYGQPASFTASANESLSVRWQTSTNGGATYTNLANNFSYSGTNTNTLTVIRPTVAQSGQLYRAVYENGSGEIASEPAILTVARAPLSAIANNTSKLYGSPVPALTGTLTGAISGDGLSAFYSSSASNSSPVNGPGYTITPIINDPNGRLGNYNLTTTTGTLTVQPAPLTVTANSAAIVYGQPLPGFGVSYSGFVLGQSSTVLTSLPVASTTATSTSPVSGGPYPINASGAAASNYAIAYVAGSLTIAAATTTTALDVLATAAIGEPVTITAMLAVTAPGTGVPTGTITFLDGQTPIGSGTIDSLGQAAFTTSSLTAGTHTISASYPGDGNYGASTSAVVELTVTSALPAPTAPVVTANAGHSLIDVGQPSGYATFSRLTSLELTFNTAVMFDPDAFVLASGSFMLTGGVEVIASGAGGNVVTLHFTGSNGVEFGSLETDIWTLSVDLSRVWNAANESGSGTAATQNIRRLFGDINGDGQVDSGDFGVFGATFGLNSSDPNFEALFDVDGNGDIDSGDFGAFGARFGTGL